MSDRIQQALDGELPIADLTPDECKELQHYRHAICVALAPFQWKAIDVSAAVSRRTHPGFGRRRLRALQQALWSPRSLSIRPVYGIAAALMLAVALWRSRAVPTQPGVMGAERVLVQFRVNAQDAHQVALVGDFNGWRPEHRLHRSADGVWSIDVALEPGVYNYVFLVDGGTVRLDPLAPRVTDGFGGQSSRVAVLMPSRRS
jgi:AMP-activated protein kinase-like protein